MSEKPHKTLYQAVAANVLRARKALGMTQHELAAASGLSRSTIAQIENARYSSLSLASLEAISAAVSVSEVELLRNDESPSPHAIEAFRTSPWFATQKPSESELKALESACALLWRSADPSPNVLAALLQVMRMDS